MMIRISEHLESIQEQSYKDDWDQSALSLIHEQSYKDESSPKDSRAELQV